MGKAVKKVAVNEPLKGITKIAVKGFKSLAKETSIEIRPLTVLAGANNSGKSSIIQPLLMMKQTIEDIYEPKSDILINGDHINFNSVDEFLSRINNRQTSQFTVKIEIDGKSTLINTYKKTKNNQINVINTIYKSEKEEVILRPDSTENEITQKYPFFKMYLESFSKGFDAVKDNLQKDVNLRELGIKLRVNKRRCFLGITIDTTNIVNNEVLGPLLLPAAGINLQKIENDIMDMIHVPANRGNPERSYQAMTIKSRFKGPINDYAASIIYNWKSTNNGELAKLGKWLKDLGLTWKINAVQLNDGRIKVFVHRLPKKGKNSVKDMVDISDVGFGISQILPVLIALIIAKENQLVYIEQPEVHLHPKAQYLVANCIADAVKRNVRVIMETQSTMLLLSIQTLVAKKELSPEQIALHWFKRDDRGYTDVTSVTLDENGAYGDWPVDFADVNYEANRDYLRAIGFKTGK